MTTTPAQPAEPQVTGAQRAAAWLRDSALSSLAVLLVLAVAASGWSASFVSLHQFAVQHMSLTPGQAWLVPATFDGAALGLSLLAFRAATYGRASLGARLYVYGFTALSSWINYVHIDDPRGRLVACLLPISAVVMFDKVLKEARETHERRKGKAVFRVRPGLLLLRLAIDRTETAKAIRGQITAIPVEALIGLGAGTLARDAADALGTPASAEAPAADQQQLVDAPTPSLDTIHRRRTRARRIAAARTRPALAIPAQFSAPVDNAVDKDADAVDHAVASSTSLVPKFVPPATRLDTSAAADRIRDGWAKGWSVTETAIYASRDKAQVSRKFAEFETAGSRVLAHANGAAPVDD